MTKQCYVGKFIPIVEVWSMKRFLIVGLALLVVGAIQLPAYAGCTTAVAVTTSSTAVLANGDITIPGGRNYVSVTNSGPDVEFCAFGTSNAATTANGIMLLIGETLAFPSLPTPYGTQTRPPNSDLACIAFSGGGNQTSNTVACDY